MKYLMILIACVSIAAWAYPQTTEKDTAVTITVYGNCDQCKQRIEAAVRGRGVTSANWDIDTKILSIVYNPSKTSLDKIQQHIVNAGHDTQFKKAKDDVYNSLPACCLYRKNEEEQKGIDSLQWQPQPVAGMIKGVVVSLDAKGKFVPMHGASVYWLGSKRGIETDSMGVFNIAENGLGSRLVISYTGFTSDTVAIEDNRLLKVILASGGQLKDVTVYSGKKSYYASALTPVRTQMIGEKELYKAACCNLSESFETNPSVDVSFNDAVTGSKQIQLLGLSGIYTQLTVENMPGPRGIATSNGLSFIPGSWIESIQLTKGTGSVANGYESIAGQINIEEKKAVPGDRLFLNAYVNDMGKTDLNVVTTQKINSKWSTALLMHDDFLNNKKIDNNNDGFRDLPSGNQFTIFNRWQYNSSNGLMGQIGIRVLTDNKTGGQVDFNPATDKFTTTHYGIGLATERYEAFAKLGYVFTAKKYKSIGLQVAAFSHNQNDYFGLTAYDAKQQNVYANLIYQSIIGNTNHKFRTGLSFLYDHYDETFSAANYTRKELVPGAFFEYTWDASTKFNMVAGIRADHNSLFGYFVTPRLNARYQPHKNTTIRISAGRGERTANIFSENTGWFVSSRAVTITPNAKGGAYGLQPEIAWNEGISIDQKFRLFNREGSVTADFFRTDFVNQVVVDVDKSATQLNFYNLQGKSYSNSIQAEINYSILKNIDVRLAYRLYDVKATYHGELLQRPLVAKQRAFTSLHYETASKWKFDYTVQLVGQKRLPYSGDAPAAYQWQSYSPSYVVMDAQVSKTVKQLELYAGVEDLNNYHQQQLIVDAANPFGHNFDASIVWGPVYGRMFYAGLRFRIK
ncbi:MAG TPA: TonB-dependent receptor [Chitinophagaceae bacterium]|nr:TonB-dependent receptor [Chitinophagaceae bacterium]